MTLTELAVTGLRCIEHAELEIPPPRLALDHGSGKTSMLSRRALGTRAWDFRTGHRPRSTWNPRRTWAWLPSGQDRRGEDPWSYRARRERSALHRARGARIPPGVGPCGTRVE